MLFQILWWFSGIGGSYTVEFAGESQIGYDIKPLDPKRVASLVRYGLIKQPILPHEARGYSLVYNQLYPFEGLQNYTSGIIHHVRLTGRFDPLRSHSLVLQLVCKTNWVHDRNICYKFRQLCTYLCLLCSSIYSYSIHIFFDLCNKNWLNDILWIIQGEWASCGDKVD